MTTQELAEFLLHEMVYQSKPLEAAPVLMARLCAVTGNKASFTEVDGKLACKEVTEYKPAMSMLIGDVVASYSADSHKELEVRLLAGLADNKPVYEITNKFE